MLAPTHNTSPRDMSRDDTSVDVNSVQPRMAPRTAGQYRKTRTAGLFGNTPLGVEKDGKWHVTVPSNFPQGGFKGWSNCAFMTVTPDRRYAPAVCKDPNVGPGDTFVIDLPKVPAEHTVQVIRVVMPQLLDYETLQQYEMSTAEASAKAGGCCGGGVDERGWFINTHKPEAMRLFPPVGVKPGEEFFVEVPRSRVCCMYESQVPAWIFCLWCLAKNIIEMAV